MTNNVEAVAELETILTECLIKFSDKNESVSVAHILAALLLRAAKIAVITSEGVDPELVRTSFLNMATRAFDSHNMLKMSIPPVGNA